jgi:hypothetical protein
VYLCIMCFSFLFFLVTAVGKVSSHFFSEWCWLIFTNRLAFHFCLIQLMGTTHFFARDYIINMTLWWKKIRACILVFYIGKIRKEGIFSVSTLISSLFHDLIEIMTSYFTSDIKLYYHDLMGPIPSWPTHLSDQNFTFSFPLYYSLHMPSMYT